MDRRCPHCEIPMLAIYDRDLDCVVAWKCEACGHEVKRDLAEVLAVADATAFPKVDPIRKGKCQ